MRKGLQSKLGDNAKILTTTSEGKVEIGMICFAYRNDRGVGKYKLRLSSETRILDDVKGAHTSYSVMESRPHPYRGVKKDMPPSS